MQNTPSMQKIQYVAYPVFAEDTACSIHVNAEDTVCSILRQHSEYSMQHTLSTQ